MNLREYYNQEAEFFPVWQGVSPIKLNFQPIFLPGGEKLGLWIFVAWA
jgi:hypothetical protein